MRRTICLSCFVLTCIPHMINSIFFHHCRSVQIILPAFLCFPRSYTNLWLSPMYTIFAFYQCYTFFFSPGKVHINFFSLIQHSNIKTTAVTPPYKRIFLIFFPVSLCSMFKHFVPFCSKLILQFYSFTAPIVTLLINSS